MLGLFFLQSSNQLGGLKFYEDENGDKYVVGADSVPKKLGDTDTVTFTKWTSPTVSKETNYYGLYNHRYSFNASSIPNIQQMTYEKDFFIGFAAGSSGQNDVNIGLSFVDVTNNIIHMRSVNGLNSLSINVYYNANFS